MSCSECQTCGHEKTAKNNQWAATAKSGTQADFKEKTAVSNQWVSTNKMATNHLEP